jgi:hypothetical protein
MSTPIIPDGYQIIPLTYNEQEKGWRWCAELIDRDGEVVGFSDNQPSRDMAMREAFYAWRRNENKAFRRDVPTAGEW